MYSFVYKKGGYYTEPALIIYDRRKFQKSNRGGKSEKDH